MVVTDHHLPGATTPPADAIVNPNQVGCNFASKSLAGVGVAFYFMLALRKYLREQQWFEQQNIKEPNIAQLLDLVALGTVADVVSLDANNRILVEQGLKRIRAGATRPGIQALIEIAGKNQQKLVASDFGFALGPRINAAGRLDDMAFGINCLLAKDLSTARVMAADLDDLNKARREIEQGMQIEAEQVLASLQFSEENLPHGISLFHADWHQGVIGIVAGRLKEKYHRPSIVFAKGSDENVDDTHTDSNEIKGSARSIPGLHIRDLLEYIDSQHPGIIAKFGGHAMAAGLSIARDQFETFSMLFEQYAQQWLSTEALTGVLASDGELLTRDMTLNVAQLLRDAGPWGQNFPEPLFDDVFTLVQQRIVGEKHLKLVVEKDQQIFDAKADLPPASVTESAKLKSRIVTARRQQTTFFGKMPFVNLVGLKFKRPDSIIEDIVIDSAPIQKGLISYWGLIYFAKPQNTAALMKVLGVYSRQVAHTFHFDTIGIPEGTISRPISSPRRIALQDLMASRSQPSKRLLRRQLQQ